MAVLLCWIGFHVYECMDLLEANLSGGPIYLITILAIYWYLCWWVTFAMIYMLIGTVMLIYYLVKCLCCCRLTADGGVGVDDDFENDEW